MRLLTIIVSVLLAGCGPAPGVDWSKYHPSVKQRIDRIASDRDCNGLQREFNISDRNSDAQRNRTGRGNGALMAYIDDRMQESGCYVPK